VLSTPLYSATRISGHVSEDEFRVTVTVRAIGAEGAALSSLGGEIPQGEFARVFRSMPGR
jgi:hypothetical protein